MATKLSTKSEVYSYISERTSLKKKEVGAVFDALSGIMARDLKWGAGAFRVPGLMRINTVYKPAVPERRGINPFTKEETTFKARPARIVVKVKPFKGLKKMV
ncbi:MAG: HU family DNA-binding protein [Acidiferrobacterales bacterium]